MTKQHMTKQGWDRQTMPCVLPCPTLNIVGFTYPTPPAHSFTSSVAKLSASLPPRPIGFSAFKSCLYRSLRNMCSSTGVCARHCSALLEQRVRQGGKS